MSMFRNAVWFMKGMREYTASGYTAASARFTDSDLEVECSGEATGHRVRQNINSEQ